MMEVPELAIVGVPKAGTTSLHSWLACLSEVDAAIPKETFFFMDRENPLANQRLNFHKKNGAGYIEFFKNRSQAQKKLDSTTHHFFQETALKIFAANETKVLVVLRDPVKRLVSYFNYVKHVRSAIDTEYSFAEFVGHLLDSQLDQHKSKFNTEEDWYSMNTVLRQSEYSFYVKKWADAISPDRFKVMIFEDLVAERQKFLAELAGFFKLESASKYIDNFKVQNESRSSNFPWINRKLRSTRGLLIRLPFFDTLRRGYHKIQTGKKIEFDWSENRASLKRLAAYFEDYNLELENLLDRRLPFWNSS